MASLCTVLRTHTHTVELERSIKVDTTTGRDWKNEREQIQKDKTKLFIIWGKKKKGPPKKILKKGKKKKKKSKKLLLVDSLAAEQHSFEGSFGGLYIFHTHTCMYIRIRCMGSLYSSSSSCRPFIGITGTPFYIFLLSFSTPHLKKRRRDSPATADVEAADKS